MIEKKVDFLYNKEYSRLVIGGAPVDRITESFLKEFSQNHGFVDGSSADQFEYFADYCAIANECST